MISPASWAGTEVPKAFAPLIEKSRSFYKSVNNLSKLMSSHTAKIRRGSRVKSKQYQTPITWKADALYSVQSLKESIKLLHQDLYNGIKNGNSVGSLDPKLIENHAKELHLNLIAISHQVNKDKYKYEIFLEAEKALNAYLAFEEQLKSNFKDFQGLQNANDLIVVRRGSITFETANQACWAVASPGTISLRKALMFDGTPDNDFGPATMKYINILEKLKGSDDVLQYRHAEVLSDLDDYNNIHSVGYYPWLFNIGKAKEDKMPMFLKINNKDSHYFNYRTKYTAFRVKAYTYWAETKKKELAMLRLATHQTYLRLGTCADFVNWTYFNAITSDWNRIPILKQAISLAWLPEGVQTPDNLADSYMTEKICEVDNSKLLFPKEVIVKSWVNRLKRDKKSGNKKINKHANDVWNFLIKHAVIKEDGTRILDIVKFKTVSWTNGNNNDEDQPEFGEDQTNEGDNPTSGNELPEFGEPEEEELYDENGDLIIKN